MFKLLVIAGIIALVVRVATGRWPWAFLTATSSRQQAIRKARALLGVRQAASRGEIVEAHRRLIGMVHPDRGGSNDQVYEANAARDLLLGELPDNR
ncbi:molecular chaperone DnaJ [Tsuneonella sp. SYSU-LHT278]|uniref:molecular chaperone DnaJ n=1 Tax=Tsuneonella sediminis TaxID=3416089 RepID=UPI003F7A7CCD